MTTPTEETVTQAWLPKRIGRLTLGERLSSDHHCGGSHDMPDGQPVYWQERGGEYPDDIDGYCLTCAITQAESDSGWCDCSVRAAIARDSAGVPDGLVEACHEMFAQAFDFYTARNGKRVSIEGDDGEKCWILPFDAFEAIRSALSARHKIDATIPRLISREIDDDCGCPEEYWEAFGAQLHVHLSAGKPSNGHADYGDEGEDEITVTAATPDLARAAIFGWLREKECPGAYMTTLASQAVREALRPFALAIRDEVPDDQLVEGIAWTAAQHRAACAALDER